MSDLEALRTPEEYATYIASLNARTAELDKQFEGRAFDDAGRSEWADIAEIKKRAEATKIELEARRRTIEELAKVERSEPRTFNVPNVRNPSQSHVPENIYDLPAYRSRTSSEEQYQQALRDGAMRALDGIVFAHPGVRQDVAKEGVQRLIDHVDNKEGAFKRHLLHTDNPAYKRAILKYAVGGENAPMTAEERAAFAMGVTTTGGYFVNPAFDPTIIPAGAWTSINAVRATARVEQIIGSNVWHGLTATAVTATRADEAAATTEQAPTLGQPSITPTKVQGQITFSIETGEDRPNLETELAVLIQEAIDTEEENSFTLGVGDALGQNTNPIGVLAAHATSGAYAHIATAADGTLAAADLDSTYAGLSLRHRARSIWLMSRSVLGAVQALETTGGRLFGSQAGYPAVGQQLPTARTGDTGLRLLGSPVYEAPSGPTSVDGANKVLMCLYNPQTFCVVDRIGTSIEYIPFIFGAAQGNLVTGQRGLYFHKRSSAKPLITTGGLQLCHQA